MTSAARHGTPLDASGQLRFAMRKQTSIYLWRGGRVQPTSERPIDQAPAPTMSTVSAMPIMSTWYSKPFPYWVPVRFIKSRGAMDF